MRDLKADLTAKLIASGAQQFTEWDPFSDEQRMMRYGLLCRSCERPAAARVTASWNAGDVYLSTSIGCPRCDGDNPAAA